MNFSKLVMTMLSLWCFHHTCVATTFRVLFLGNSYTGVNNLPQVIADIAASNGDSLSFLNYNPGGYTLQNHWTDPTSISLINQGNWDYVVLQEQSQLPSFPIGQVQISVYPYARSLDSLITANNPCAETVFYMTWGREFGDASNCSSWPAVCTYEGMDSLLNLRYMTMASDNNAIVSPVGAVWKFIRQNYPLINLYQIDESHPSVEGTYAAACCFYTSIFRKDPTQITYNSGLHFSTAATIRQVIKTVVFDEMSEWYIGTFDPKADYSYINLGGNFVSFANNSTNSVNYRWNFNDASTSTLANPIHYFSAPGIYDVELISYNCMFTDTSILSVNVTSTGMEDLMSDEKFSVYPNPATDFIEINNISTRHANCTVEIIDLYGKIVLASRLEGRTETKLDVTNLHEGYYFINITSTAGFKQTMPLVLKKF